VGDEEVSEEEGDEGAQKRRHKRGKIEKELSEEDYNLISENLGREIRPGMLVLLSLVPAKRVLNVVWDFVCV
jgi:hypothetical protein